MKINKLKKKDKKLIALVTVLLLTYFGVNIDTGILSKVLPGSFAETETNVESNKEIEKATSVTADRLVCEVVRVVDGDTIVVNIDGQEEKIRLIGVNTPESVHPDKSKNTEAGVTASDYTKSLLENQNVTLEFDVQERDKYGRLLAYVYLEDGTFLNEKLVIDGYADIATYPPNVKYVEMFKKAQENRNK